MVSYNKQFTHYADIGITTDTASNLSSTCVVLACVTGHQDSQFCANSQQQMLGFVQQLSKSATLLPMTVTIASDMHFNALRGLKYPCMNAYCIRLPMLQASFRLYRSTNPWEQVAEVRSIKGTSSSRSRRLCLYDRLQLLKGVDNNSCMFAKHRRDSMSPRHT